MTQTRRKKGYVWRKPHSRRMSSGSIVHIPGMWVRSVRTSHYAWAKKQKASLAKSHAISRKKYGTISCPKGKIVRTGYVRKSYTRSSPYGGKKRISVRRTVVPYSCISDMGLSGKGPRTIGGKLASIGPVRKGTLRKYGYSLSKPSNLRHRALRKAIKARGRNTIMRKVNAIYVWFKNTNKRYSSIAARDKNWIRENYPKK